MSQARALRVLLIANDGFSAGHVVRTLAIARGLARGAQRRGLAVQAVVATTSEASALLAAEPVAVVTMPAPATARRAGLADPARRRLVRATLDGVIAGFAPDVLVVDTFPSGPHGELAGLSCAAKRVLVRRATVDLRGPRAALPADQRDVLTAGLSDYALAVIASDAGLAELAGLGVATTVVVPPITLGEPRDGLDRAAARRQLGLLEGRRAILVAAGGGGDGEAVARAERIAGAIARVATDTQVVIALGPLTPGSERSTEHGRVRWLRVAPLAPVLAAFDGAVSPAGYNTAHELAKARVPAALFAQARSFDDQAARAARLAALGWACVVEDFADGAIAGALAWMQGAALKLARLPAIEDGGADRAADAIFALVTGASQASAAASQAEAAG